MNFLLRLDLKTTVDTTRVNRKVPQIEEHGRWGAIPATQAAGEPRSLRVFAEDFATFSGDRKRPRPHVVFRSAKERPFAERKAADGEDDPADVPRLLARLQEEGHQNVVFAERSRKSESITFRIFLCLLQGPALPAHRQGSEGR
jgi:hypothetical protein